MEQPTKHPSKDLQQKTSYLPDIHRLLPQSPDAEQGVLSSILLAPMEVMGLLDEKGLRPEHFHIPAHGIIFDEMRVLKDRKKPLDVISLTNHLRNVGKLDYVGGPAFVTQLFTFLPTAANAAFYLEIMREKFTLREVIRVCTEYAARAYEEQDQVAAICEGVIIDLEAIVTDRYETGAIECVTDEAFARMWQRFDARLLDDSDGLMTGIEKWDQALGGVRNGRMYVLGARPKVGKTSLIETMISNQLRNGARIVVLQRDMRVDDMIGRMACRDANEVFEDFDRGDLPEHRMGNLRRALSAIARDRLRFYSPQAFTPDILRSIINLERRKGGVDAVYVDVFQRMTLSYTKGLGTTEILTEASKAIRDMTIEYNIPIIVVAHMNKESEKTGRPTSSQFKYCDQLFSDCDVAALMWTEDDPKQCYNAQTGTWKRQEIVLTVDANRGGFVGDVKLYFDRPRMKFYGAPFAG